MDASPSSPAPDAKTTTPLGSASAPVESSASSAQTPLKPEPSEAAAVSTPNEPAPTLSDSERPEEFEYEFSHWWEGRLYFSHCWATNILSAAQKMVCVPSEQIECKKDEGTGQWLVKPKTFFAVDAVNPNASEVWTPADFPPMCCTEKPYKRSFTVPDCKPLPEELTKRKPTAKVDSVLEGLI